MPSLLVAELDAPASKSRFTVIDELDSLAGWTISGTVAVDSVNYRSGGAAFKISPAISGTAYADKVTGGMNLAGVGNNDEIRWHLYVDDPTRVASVTLRLYDNAGSPVQAEYVRTGAQVVAGWQRFSIPKTAFTNFATFNWSAVTEIRLIAVANGTGVPNITFDMLRLMLSPNVGFTNGRWDESHGALSFTDGKFTFFDTGYIQLTDVRIKPTDMYRLDSAATGIVVTMGDGYVQVSGLGGTFTTLEVIAASWSEKQALEFEEPAYYDDSLFMDAMRTAQSKQTQLFWSAIIDTFRQTLIGLATYMLKKHEMLLDSGDSSSSGKSLAERRSRTLQRFTAAFLPMNIVGMQKLVQFFVTSAQVTHTPATYSFTVMIISPKGVPANLSDIVAAIDRSKPAHLNYTIVYTFTSWNTMDAYNRTWNVAETYTWDAFEIS